MSHVAPTDEQLATLCIEFGVTDPADCVDATLGSDSEGFEPGTFNTFQSVGICRPGDTLAVIDLLKSGKIGAEVDFDTSRIGVAGWSGGSTTPMQLAGGSRIIAVGMEAYRVTPGPDIGAFVALSAQGPGFSNWYDEEFYEPPVTGTSWDEVVGPMLMLTGVFDEANGMVAEDRLKPYGYMPAGDKRLFYSGDDQSPFTHNTFNLEHLDIDKPHVEALNTAITSSVLAFLDWHLLERPEAGAWLDAGNASALLGEGSRWETK